LREKAKIPSEREPASCFFKKGGLHREQNSPYPISFYRHILGKEYTGQRKKTTGPVDFQRSPNGT
jgi:hypothetical protein